ncbi:MAG: hypothetical protein P8J14_06420 [Emcibacteraceae bacterium]|nr:hypothetical protein [Emcibacteraceae bacterium]
MKDLCYKCQRSEGNYPKDQGAHTAMKKACAKCGVVTGILPERHYTKIKPKWFTEK